VIDIGVSLNAAAFRYRSGGGGASPAPTLVDFVYARVTSTVFLPAAQTVNDQLIVLALYEFDDVDGTSVIDLPSGWTNAGTMVSGSGSARLCWRIWHTGDPTTVSITGIGATASYTCCAFSGAHETTPLSNIVATFSEGPGITIPAIAVDGNGLAMCSAYVRQNTSTIVHPLLTVHHTEYSGTGYQRPSLAISDTPGASYAAQPVLAGISLSGGYIFTACVNPT